MRPRRVILIATAILVAVLFISPIRSYQEAQSHLARAKSQLAAAQADNARLVAQLARAGTRGALVEQARALGYVFPGETPYSVVTP
jgi:cell division protein FtsB